MSIAVQNVSFDRAIAVEMGRTKFDPVAAATLDMDNMASEHRDDFGCACSGGGAGTATSMRLTISI